MPLRRLRQYLDSKLWVVPLLCVLGGSSRGGGLGQLPPRTTRDRQRWNREGERQRERWNREDQQRREEWDHEHEFRDYKERRSAYSELMASTDRLFAVDHSEVAAELYSVPPGKHRKVLLQH